MYSSQARVIQLESRGRPVHMCGHTHQSLILLLTKITKTRLNNEDEWYIQREITSSAIDIT